MKKMMKICEENSTWSKREWKRRSRKSFDKLIRKDSNSNEEKKKKDARNKNAKDSERRNLNARSNKNENNNVKECL